MPTRTRARYQATSTHTQVAPPLPYLHQDTVQWCLDVVICILLLHREVECEGVDGKVIFPRVPLQCGWNYTAMSARRSFRQRGKSAGNMTSLDLPRLPCTDQHSTTPPRKYCGVRSRPVRNPCGKKKAESTNLSGSPACDHRRKNATRISRSATQLPRGLRDR